MQDLGELGRGAAAGPRVKHLQGLGHAERGDRQVPGALRGEDPVQGNAEGVVCRHEIGRPVRAFPRWRGGEKPSSSMAV